MSVLQYGDETFKMCKVQSFALEHVMDESGIDYLYSQVTITITAVCSPDLEGGTALNAIMDRIRRNVSCPRQVLQFWVGGDETDNPPYADRGDDENAPPDPRWGHEGYGREEGDLESGDGAEEGGSSGSYSEYPTLRPRRLQNGKELKLNEAMWIPAPDLKNGPFCKNYHFAEIGGTRFAIFTGTFVGHKHACTTPPSILSNRWSTQSHIDENQLTRITTSGRLIINPSGEENNADSYRRNCIPTLLQNFTHVSFDVKLSPDGLMLDYTHVMQEQYQLPPPDLMRVEAEYGETTEGGAIMTADMSISAVAKRTIPKATILGRIAQIILSRFDFANFGAIDDSKDLMLSASFKESMMENRISVAIRARKPLVKNNQLVLPMDPRVVGKPLPVVKANDDFDAHGTALGFMLRAVWKTCCEEAGSVVISAIGTLSPSPELSFSFSIGELPVAEEDELSEESRQHPYKSYGHVQEYEQVSGTVLMPYMEEETNSGGESTGKTAAFIRLHQPHTRKHVRFTSERHRQWPRIPKAMTHVEGGMVLNSKLETEPPKLGADLNSYTFGLSGQYTVGVDHVLDEENDEVVGGVSPMYKMPVEDSYVPSDSFRDDLTEDPTA